VSKAVAGLSKRPYIFTKCSLVWDRNGVISHSLKRDSVRKEVEDSLKRLRVDAIDLYQIHWPDPDAEIEEGWTTLAELKREGKVRYIGVSNFDVEQMRRAQAIAPIDSLQPPYSLIHPEVEDEILPFCEANNIGVIVYSPMMSGLLSGRMTRQRIANLPEDDWRSKSPDFQEPHLSRNLQLAELLRNIGSRHGRSAGEVAIAWTLRLPAVTGAIVGGRGPEQVEGIIGAGTFRLNEAEIAEIETVARANVAQAVW